MFTNRYYIHSEVMMGEYMIGVSKDRVARIKELVNKATAGNLHDREVVLVNHLPLFWELLEYIKEHEKMPSTTIQYFVYDHLPTGRMRLVSKRCAELARDMEDTLDDGPEKSAGMRKLLEAKDCFVRAALEGPRSIGV